MEIKVLKRFFDVVGDTWREVGEKFLVDSDRAKQLQTRIPKFIEVKEVVEEVKKIVEPKEVKKPVKKLVKKKKK